MRPLFFYGALRHISLLETVLGRSVDIWPARLSGFEARGVGREPFPGLVAASGARCEGLLLQEPSTAELARLAFFAGVERGGEVPGATRDVAVETDEGPIDALMFAPADAAAAAEPWDFEHWRARWGAMVTVAAREIMAQFGRLSPAELQESQPQIMARAASELRAAGSSAPADLRSALSRSQIETQSRARPYIRYFAVGEEVFRFPKFNGEPSEPVLRAALMSADAVTVLPYDPKRDCVLLIEQFRFGVYLRGDPHPWVLEPIAGRIDPGETPETTALREAREEAELDVRELVEIGRYYPSPGAMTEFLISYIGIADLPDSAELVAGLDEEAEDIRTHVIPFDRLMALCASGEAAVGPLIQSAQWIALHRERLRGFA